MSALESYWFRMAEEGGSLIMTVVRGGGVSGEAGKAGEVDTREVEVTGRTAWVGRGHGGFTLIELMVVMALLVVLAGVVVGGVTGTTDVGRDTAATADKSTIQSAVDRYYSDANPQQFPVISSSDNIIDYSAILPQDSTKTFVPVYLKEIPKSTAYYEWHIDTQSGRVYSVKMGGVASVPGSSASLSVAAEDVARGVKSGYTFDVNFNKGEAVTNGIRVTIPRAYSLTTPAGVPGVVVGYYSVKVLGDSDLALGWVPHSRTAEIRVQSLATSSTPETWAVWEDSGATQTHTIAVTPPTSSRDGAMVITLDHTRTPFVDSSTKTMGASAVMSFTVGTASGKTVTNPASAGPYPWSAFQNSALDSAGVYVIKMPGVQKVDIR